MSLCKTRVLSRPTRTQIPLSTRLGSCVRRPLKAGESLRFYLDYMRDKAKTRGWILTLLWEGKNCIRHPT